MTKLIHEKILKTEERPLLDSEIKVLTGKRNRLLTYLLSSYLPLVIILVVVIASGPGMLGHGKWSGPHEVSEAEQTNFNIVAPWVCAFFFVMLTGFFGGYYLQVVHPLVKDIRRGGKLVLTIQLEKREPFFGRYFIYTPIRKSRQIEIDSKDYYHLKEGSVKMVITPYSYTIIQLLNEEQDVQFNLPA